MSLSTEDSDSVEAAELHAFAGNLPSIRQREGLPPGFRMRADAHYVEQLESSTGRVAPVPPALPSNSLNRDSHRAPLEREIDAALNGIASAAALIAGPSRTIQTGAARLVQIECRRALRLLTALRVLGAELPVRRSTIGALPVVNRVVEAFEEEHRWLDLPHRVRITADTDVPLNANADLLFTAVSNALAVLEVAVDVHRPRSVEISVAAARSAPMGSISVCEDGLSIPQAWVDSAFERPWPVEKGPAAQALLRGAQEIARWHGGTVAIATDHGGTWVRIDIPLA